ncbi:Imm49 family immunity protein [Streptomyces sp. NPDC057543]|uniref:Imm49 family immunity protein n=1 Tax=Streptomyces sp. NPDC057543 TaxID=3346163 RepID=UPI0036CFB163
MTGLCRAGLRLASRLGAVLFRTTLAEPGTGVEATIDGHTLTYPAYHGDEAGPGQWHTAINLDILALTCHARRRGWNIRVTSAYLPERILRAAEPLQALLPRRSTAERHDLRRGLRAPPFPPVCAGSGRATLLVIREQSPDHRQEERFPP